MDERALPDRVRAAAARVAAEARHVRIDHDRLLAVADTVPHGPVSAPSLDPGDLPAVDEDGIVAWVLTINAINFGSGFFPVLRKRAGLSGSKTVFAALRERFDVAGAFAAEELASVTADDCAQLFEQDPSGPAAELMAWFATAWRHLGTTVAGRHRGRFVGLVEAADGSAVRLAELLAEVPGWDDVAHHGVHPVPFYKRAQIAPAHLAMALGGLGHGELADLERLTIFADNLVPHVLRIEGALRYDDLLLARIERGDLLEPGSAEEVEIRAVAVHASELIVAELRHRGVPATAMGLDQVLWQRGGEPRCKALPRHRARTTAY